ncbi:MAG: hypothetical protein KAR20_23935 [Candidatus Heimdallarchaeota archaeon]|nr:hypothetical protein [Candidatus Heimdallarchaeota archaeon]
MIFPIMSTILIAGPQSTMNQQVISAPSSADLQLPNSMVIDQDLIYETWFSKTEFESSPQLTFTITTQNITVENDQTLTVHEKVYTNSWSYQIFPELSNIPQNSETFPSQFSNGGWSHNYPVNEEAFSVNTFEINYFMPCDLGYVMDLEYHGTEVLTFEELSLSTKVFQGSLVLIENGGSA